MDPGFGLPVAMVPTRLSIPRALPSLMSLPSSVHPLCISATHPALPGHFPGQPVVPGVVILDAVLAVLEGQDGHARSIARLPQVKFLAPLLPEQQARIELERSAERVRFRVLCDTTLLANGELVLAPS